MNILLVAINARYEHEGLAVWYLKAACEQHSIPVKVMQFSINDSQQKIWASILDENPDVVAFSCYIWNRDVMLKLINDLKKARPKCRIIVGGPETGYSGAQEDYYAFGADYLIKGAGEYRFPMLLKQIKGGNSDRIKEELLQDSCNKNDYISPFSSEYLARIKDRIAYIESSRGCPYRCSYCLSSLSRGMVFHPIDEIKKDLEKLVAAKAKVIKFVDRSFNANEKHALAIWDIIKGFSNEDIVFHFEINPDILTKAQIDCLASMRPGLVQLEAGIQSVNPDALKEVSRVMNVGKAISNLKVLMSKGNIHIHTDLIAGLPYDTLESFKEAFNRIYEIKAHHMQLGFLKLLRGTRIREEAEKHGFKYREYPPYEIIENKYLGVHEILILKEVEEVLDRTWNSGRFTYSLEYIVEFFDTPFDLYEGFAKFLMQKCRLYQPMSAASLFKLIREYALDIEGIDSITLHSLLALDYACSLKNSVIPEFLADDKVKTIDIREILEEHAPKTIWKKEYRKKYMVIEGSFPDRIVGESIITDNRVLLDMDFIDPVTNRVVPDNLSKLFTLILN